VRILSLPRVVGRGNRGATPTPPSPPPARSIVERTRYRRMLFPETSPRPCARHRAALEEVESELSLDPAVSVSLTSNQRDAMHVDARYRPGPCTCGSLPWSIMRVTNRSRGIASSEE